MKSLLIPLKNLFDRRTSTKIKADVEKDLRDQIKLIYGVTITPDTENTKVGLLGYLKQDRELLMYINKKYNTRFDSIYLCNPTPGSFLTFKGLVQYISTLEINKHKHNKTLL